MKTNNDFLKILNIISSMEGNSLVEKILDYCETHDEDPQEIGDYLEDNKEFKKILYNDCINNNIIRNQEYKMILNRTEKLEEW